MENNTNSSSGYTAVQALGLSHLYSEVLEAAAAVNKNLLHLAIKQGLSPQGGASTPARIAEIKSNIDRNEEKLMRALKEIVVFKKQL